VPRIRSRGAAAPAAPVVAVVAALAAAALAGASTTGAAAAGTTAGTTVATAAGTAAPGTAVVPGATPVAPASPVLPAVDPAAAVPTAAGLERALGPVLRRRGLGGRVSAEVVDLSTGRVLLSRSPERAAVPASTAKLMTGAAALSLLTPSARLETVVVSGAQPGEVVLVGGGDVLLGAGRGRQDAVVGHAGLQDLATATADALTRQGLATATVRVDDRLFTGSSVAPGWSGDVDAGFVAPVTALAVNAGTADPVADLGSAGAAGRVRDPALSAGQTFARLLAARGVPVTGTVTRSKAPDGATRLAAVRSATVGDLVEHALTSSDNTASEALARVVAARSGAPATFAGAGAAVVRRVAALGVPTAGATLGGGSGLGTGYAVSARTLARLLAVAASPEHPELRPLLSGLPVAGASGTLAVRFADGRARAGAGVVRAKTGTLTGASSLAGTAVDADGRHLGFVLLADRVASTAAARAALDDAAAVIATCGCR
jgi:D-alanyl-D-alanine carboxypeptidase/D-alanyl-D-alanine-endopeptidase (penicillin-binding protein 4)